MKMDLKSTEADRLIDECLEKDRCFHVIAGAGSGKTASLIQTLENIRDRRGAILRKNGQRVVCLTFTKRAVEVIRKRLRWDDLFIVSTLHSFLWGEVNKFSKDIRKTLYDDVLPNLIVSARKDDDGRQTKKAISAREKAERFEAQREALSNVISFCYKDGPYSDYEKGELGHEDVIKVAASLIKSHEPLRRLIGHKYPYIFIDEAQDTHEEIVTALNAICANEGLPVIGYFGDPMQQIYDKRAGSFEGPTGSLLIPKNENFRCSNQVIKLLNAFRKDLQQFPAGENSKIEGSVKIRCIEVEKPESSRNRYSDEQTKRAVELLDKIVSDWGWNEKQGVKHLYLVRQMIARRLGFITLHSLFDKSYASQKAKEEFETGNYFLLKPFINCLCPLMNAFREKNTREQVDILRQYAPAFDPRGANAKKKLADMMKVASECTDKLNKLWHSGTAGDILRYAVDAGMIRQTERLIKHLSRQPRTEAYDEEKYGSERQDWLVDNFFGTSLLEIEKYCEFITENTVYSTQHGVKGEEYDKVLIVFDDVGSGWTQYNFSDLLTPNTYKQTAKNQATDRQKRLSNNLAYVCFSRALVDLRIVFFTSNADMSAKELISSGLFTNDQVEC